MERYSLSEVIEQAVQTEKLGNDDGLRKLFETLALKEQTHEQRFSQLKERVKDEAPEGWEEVSQYIRAIVESEFFLGKGKSLPSLEHIKTVGDAVRFAIGFEKETLLYFYAIRDVIREKGAIEEIIAEEKSHIIWLGKFEMGLVKL